MDMDIYGYFADTIANGLSYNGTMVSGWYPIHYKVPIINGI